MSSDSKLYALVMAGGQGTRFWPESVSKKPKQYLRLVSEKSLLAESLERFEGLVAPENRYIVTVEDQAQLAQTNSQGMINEEGLIFEPSGRNTAPCIMLALASLLKGGANENDVVAVVPSDHVILNSKGFQQTIQLARDTSLKNQKIVTIGINPNFPHTGYGYIHREGELEKDVFSVKEFVEKPDFETAKKYLESGNYLWNAGMFVSSIGVFLREFEKCSPETFSHFTHLKEALGDKSQLAEAYSKIPKESVDYAVMEKTSEILVTPAQFDWNDLGSWDALESVIEKENENTVAKARATHFINSKGNIVFAPDKFVSLINVNDLIVVSNDKNVVVLPKSDSQKVKEVVVYLKESSDLADLL